MDYQSIFNIVATAGVAALGWFARQLWDATQKLREDLSKLREEIARGYVTKDDFKDAIKDLKEILMGIDSKLDRKADK